MFFAPGLGYGSPKGNPRDGRPFTPPFGIVLRLFCMQYLWFLVALSGRIGRNMSMLPSQKPTSIDLSYQMIEELRSRASSFEVSVMIQVTESKNDQVRVGEVKHHTYGEAEGSTTSPHALGHTGHLVNSTIKVFPTEYALFGYSGSLSPHC